MTLIIRDFFDLSTYAHSEIFNQDAPPWEPLHGLKTYMDQYQYPAAFAEFVGNSKPLSQTMIFHGGELLSGDDCQIEFGDATKGKLKVTQAGAELAGASVLMAGAFLTGGQISIGEGAMIETGAFVKGPTIIGDQTEVRQGAYLRGYCLVGARCVVGHVTEVKHAIFLDDAKAGHFAYLGDSILGNDVNLGAGTKLANLRFTGGDVQIKTAEGSISSGLRKLGAIMGDKAQTGCNSVTNPGTVLGKKGIILPNTTAPSGFHPKGSLIR